MKAILSDDELRQCWFLAGPTAGGKTATALILCERIDAEVLSLDSMAIYRGMDVGTAKPTAAEQSRVPHHLIDIVDPSVDFSVRQYIECATLSVRDVLSRNRTPLFVGGTGLYLRSLLRGVFEGPPADWSIRRELEAHADTHGNEALHTMLAKADSETAARLHPNDQRRVIRAIEVFRLTGKPLSQLQRESARPIERRPHNVFWLHPPRDWLHQRINRRVDMMVEEGLVEETQWLLEHQPPASRTARQALGYRELIRYLSDKSTLAEAVDDIKSGTRQFAKRQHTWFRNLEEATSIDMTGGESPEDVAAMIQGCAKPVTSQEPDP